VAAQAPAGQTFERPDLDGSFVAPRNGVEEKLALIWENLLGVSPVGVEDSFFDLGGHSLIAVRLFATVKRELKVDFPISVLFEAPTIEKLAALIVAQTGDAGSSADAGQTAAAPNLRHLAMQFSAERPVYGVQARGLIGDMAPHTRIEDAAADYLSEIRRLQPEGPYLLAGYSGGGITAYEMAQQLAAAGEEVATLALLDTPLPVRPTLTAPDKALIKIAELRSKGPGYLVEWVQNRRAWNAEQRAGPQADGAGGTEFNNTKIEMAFRTAVGVYQLRPWKGAITLFRPPLDLHWKVSQGNWVTQEKEYAYADNQWTPYAPQLQVIEVPGDHESMVLAPSVTVLAQELSEVIAEALRPATAQATAAE